MLAKILVRKSARKRLLRLPKHIHIKVINCLDAISLNPLVGIKLHGELSEYYKFRVGDYRILYKFDSKRKLVEVAKIEHRQGVYK